jgi:surface protein
MRDNIKIYHRMIWVFLILAIIYSNIYNSNTSDIKKKNMENSITENQRPIASYDPNTFSSIWYSGPSSPSVLLPLVEGGTYNFLVEWGDGNSDTITTWNDPARDHNYASVGTYTINITGICIGFRFANGGDRAKIQLICQWGNISLGNAGMYFQGCYNLEINATDFPNLNGMTNMAHMFDACQDLETVPNINSWNVSNITTMASMFQQCYVFNDSIGSWNVSNVQDMDHMFNIAGNFNQNITEWNVCNVTDMADMFYNADDFNQPIGSWNVSRVKNMSNMFYHTEKFNQDLSNWNVSNLENTYFMFSMATAFNGSLKDWDVSSVENMAYMFQSAYEFNQNLSDWDVSHATEMQNMFHAAYDFNQDLSQWNVSKVTNMRGMFETTNNFDQNISNWNTSMVTDMGRMFEDAPAFNQPIGEWNTSSVTTMDRMFYGATSFNQNISGWNVSNVISMQTMFQNANSFNQDLGGWNVSKVNNYNDMFNGVTLNLTNYDNLLIGWAAIPSLQSSMSFHAGNSKYSPGGVAETARNILTTTHFWTITDGGEADIAKPTWNETPTDQLVPVSKDFEYKINASDNYALHKFWLDNTSVFSIDNTGQITNNTNLLVGNYPISVYVNDTSGNINSKLIIITVFDDIYPVWVESFSSQIILNTVSFSYDVNASDNIQIDQYWLSDMINFTIDSAGMLSNNTKLKIGLYILTIFVNDTRGNSISGQMQFKVWENIAPTWIIVPTDQTLLVGLSLNYQINASDNEGIDRYWLDSYSYFNISANGTITNHKTLTIGSYALTIYVNDTSGNTISKSIIIKVVESEDVGELQEPLYRQSWFWGAISAGVSILYTIYRILKQKKSKKLISKLAPDDS